MRIYILVCCILLLTLCVDFAVVSTAMAAAPLRTESALSQGKVFPFSATATATGDISITGYFMNLEAQGLAAVDLANALVGQGIQISNVTSNCADYAAGTYAISGDVGIGIPAGIILSTGLITNMIGPNTYAGISANNKRGGDADLNALIPGKNTFDACVLEFDFVPQNPNVSFKYVFASEEYNEYVNTNYNDVFGFFIDGINCATVNEANVSVNTINNTINSGFFIDNTLSAYNIEMDGYTKVMTCSAAVAAGTTHHMKLAIADAGDSAWDANVFIGSQSLVSAQHGVTLSPANIQNTASCGSSITYELVLQNTGAVSDSFTMTLSGNAWPTVFNSTGTDTMTVGPLDPLVTATFSATVSIPDNICGGHDAALITATSSGSPDVFIQSTLASSAESKRVLNVSIVNSQGASGSVNSTFPLSPSIACPGICSASYPHGTQVVLGALPSWHSTVLWAGCTSVLDLECSLTMISDFGLSAEFYPLLTVMRSGPTSGEYNTIQSAYDASATGDVLLIQKAVYQIFKEDLALNLPVEIALKGGMDSTYLSADGFTIVEGSIRISNGMVSIDRIVVK